MPTLPGLDLDALAAWLAAEGLSPGPLVAERDPGGRSYLTYLVSDGEHEWVLRCPPPERGSGAVRDVAREHQVLSALVPTPVPVPTPVALCEDPSVIGVPFLLMQRVHGVVLRTRGDLARVSRQERHRLGLRMMDVLADLHAVDPGAVGLAGLGRAEGFLAREVRRWGQQLDRSRSRQVPGIDVLRVRLAATVPPPRRTAVVHGDYRLDNLVVDLDGIDVVAVLDWEHATVGDPLADLGVLLAYRQGSGVPRSPLGEGVAPAAGFPSTEELLDRYTERAGLSPDDLSGLAWATAFGYFRMAVTLERLHYRGGRGQPTGAGAEDAAAAVPALVDAGLAALERR